jgi:uncharacterized tellurite resistance protein B-like protein
VIIFGTRGVTGTVRRGEFHCPECGCRRPYAHKRVRRFFTLYFIPLIPLDKLSEYVECQRCRTSFKLEVLSFDPEADAAQLEDQFRQAVRQAMAAVAVADGHVERIELAAMRRVCAEVFQQELAEAELEEAIAEARAKGNGLGAWLRSLAPHLNDQGKELVIRAALAVATADGAIHERESTVIGTIAQALHVSQAHLRGLVAEVIDPEQTHEPGSI